MRIRVAAVATVLLTLAAQSFAAYKISVWVPPWNANALTSIQLNGGAITESNPIWYSWNADYSIAKEWNSENPTWRSSMSGLLMPTVQNAVNGSFDGNASAAMLATAATRDAHANALTQLAVSNGYDGVDIDYERVPTASRANFTTFVNGLAAKLHAANKKLSVTVYAKAGDNENWNGPGSQDWIAIGGAADSVKIMAYDYHWSTSAAGAIAPLDWLDQVATYAEKTIPGSKIMMGLPWYGYDWPATGGASNASFASAHQTMLTNNAALQRDAASGEPYFSYSGHTVYFQDAAGYAKKIDLLKQKHGGIGGFAHWAAGVEDPDIWKVISGTPVTPPPPPPVTPPSSGSGGTPVQSDFLVSGPTTMTVMQGGSVSGDFQLVPVNGFTGTASVAVAKTFSGTAVPGISMIAAGSAVKIYVTATAAPGTYTMTVSFTSGATTHQQSVTVTITPNTARHRAAKR
ncbi:MAG TPA: glycosyl hydrolase family 18 protein [Thermoanaerobaculia bacterium]|nr:glycosyl hydrolase family 18 protein [Thermoanaerobaculia bacterium]